MMIEFNYAKRDNQTKTFTQWQMDDSNQMTVFKQWHLNHCN